MMMPLPAVIIAIWEPFAVLRCCGGGAVLGWGPRTVAAVRWVMSLGGERRFEQYHRVLSRARWSGRQGAKILLGLLSAILPNDWPLGIGVDETLEHRQGRRMAAQGRYR